MSDQEIPVLARELGLEPHPEGGWFAETWRAGQAFQPEGYPGTRSAATAIYFLLCPGQVSRWHTVRSAEMWLWHRGGPLELLLGGDGDAPSATPEVLRVGPDIENGERPQALVPGGVWQAARPAGDQEVLVSCVVAPGFDYEDFHLIDQRPDRIRASAGIALDRSAAEVWEVVADFDGIHRWHPLLAECVPEQDPETGARCRRLTTADGATIRERLVVSDPVNRVLSYEFTESPFPVRDYQATIAVTESANGALVEWRVDFTADSDRRHWQSFFTEQVLRPGVAALRDHLR